MPPRNKTNKFERRDRAHDDADPIDTVKLFDRPPPHSPEAEKGVLASMLLDFRVIDDVALVLKAEHFYSPSYRTVFEAIMSLHNNRASVELNALVEKLTAMGELHIIGGLPMLLDIVESQPIAHNAVWYATTVRDRSIQRKLLYASVENIRDVFDVGGEEDNAIKSLVERAEGRVMQVSEDRVGDQLGDLTDTLHDLMTMIDTAGTKPRGLPTGYHDLDAQVRVLPGHLIIVGARPSMGKAQPLDSKVLTPACWKTMGSLKVGDALASTDGKPSKVTHIHPQGRKQVYRITFSDGRSTECCDDHLWTVTYRDWDAPRVVSTAKLRDILTKKRYRNRVYIPTYSGHFGAETKAPVDPWLLGYLLGHAVLAHATPLLAAGNKHAAKRVASLIPKSLALVPTTDRKSLRISQRTRGHLVGHCGVTSNPLTKALERLGLQGKRSWEKFVPSIYMNADRSTRVAVLSGLLDSDGWVEKHGSVVFSTASKQLANDVVELVRSIGGIATLRIRTPFFRYKLQRKQGRPAYTVGVMLQDRSEVFTTPAKRSRVKKNVRTTRLNVVSIEPTRKTQAQCITVSHPSRSYITDDYIVTHNSAMATSLCENFCLGQGKRGLFFTLEMSRLETAERMLASLSGVPMHRLTSGHLTGWERNAVVKASAEMSQMLLCIDDTPSRTMTDIAAVCRRMKRDRKGGLDFVVIDYLQLIEAENVGARETRETQVAQISKRLKRLARELDVPVFCLAQCNRQVADTKDQRPKLHHLRESGSVEQDADQVWFVHREEYYAASDYEKAKVAGDAELIVAKQRNGWTGTIHLTFIKERCRFESKSHLPD